MPTVAEEQIAVSANTCSDVILPSTVEESRLKEIADAAINLFAGKELS